MNLKAREKEAFPGNVPFISNTLPWELRSQASLCLQEPGSHLLAARDPDSKNLPCWNSDDDHVTDVNIEGHWKNVGFKNENARRAWIFTTSLLYDWGKDLNHFKNLYRFPIYE